MDEPTNANAMCHGTRPTGLLRRRANLARVPHVFVLTRDDDEEEARDVVAWGMALPDGSAVTCGDGGKVIGSWENAYSAARCLYADLEWV